MTQFENQQRLSEALIEKRNQLWMRGPDKVLVNKWAMFSTEEAKRQNLSWDHILLFPDGFSLGIPQSLVPYAHELNDSLRGHGKWKWSMSKPSLQERFVEIDLPWGD
ncbi:MAG: hypothetical protein HYT64_02140 [Candidatus Yanofskybacteria bacterium]|nr:hypothetical protein [Candidatus Yanofskybacteria bacterium]